MSKYEKPLKFSGAFLLYSIESLLGFGTIYIIY